MTNTAQAGPPSTILDIYICRPPAPISKVRSRSQTLPTDSQQPSAAAPRLFPNPTLPPPIVQSAARLCCVSPTVVSSVATTGAPPGLAVGWAPRLVYAGHLPSGGDATSLASKTCLQRGSRPEDRSANLNPRKALLLILRDPCKSTYPRQYCAGPVSRNIIGCAGDVTRASVHRP